MSVIVPDNEITEYQIEILKRLKEMFKDLQFEIGRGDRLMVNGKVTKGFLVYDVRNRKDYDADAMVFALEIEHQFKK